MDNRESISFEDYFNKIESYFALKRDKAILLSPEEFEVVEFFYNEGIPLKVVLKGIDRFFEKKKKRKRKRKRKTNRIYFLTHVKESIETVWEDYKRKGTGSYLVTGETESEFIVERVDGIVQMLKESHQSLFDICCEVEKKLADLKDNADNLTLEDAERELDTILEFATKRIFDILNSELTEIKDEVEREVDSLLKSLGKDISPDVIERFKRQIVFEKLNFPNISLFD